MKSAWWKIGTIVLLLYTVIIGLWIPLKPSITHVSNKDLVKGRTPVTIYIQNGKLTQSKHLAVWIYSKTDVIKVPSLKVMDNQMLEGSIDLNHSPQHNVYSLVVETDFYRDTLYNAFFYQNAATAKTFDSVHDDIKPVDAKTFKPVGFSFPNREILNETIRNLFFHVPIWFAMMLVAGIGLANGIRYLRKGVPEYDMKSEKYLKATVLMGILGLITGAIWARFTWGNWWAFDVKLNGAAITVLIYIAYLVLRSGITDEIQRARISAVYSIFAFVLMLLFVMIVPRIYDSLHPGNGGNPGANIYDLDGSLRRVFYPAVLAWMGIAVWIAQLHVRYQRLKNKRDENI